jgi:Rad3-related DNA helicase
MGKGNAQAKVELGINFWCMNPAIGFADLEEARSVIVTSGTLSPMTSFQSELGAKFPHSLSTDHVISPSQVNKIDESTHDTINSELFWF